MTSRSSSTLGSKAFRDYIDASNDIWRFVVTIYGSAIKESSSDIAPNEIEAFYTSLDENISMIDHLESNKRIFTEMMLVRVADNFLAYLTDLLRLVMTAKPETILAEKGKLDIRQVLESTSLEELKKEIIEDRIQSLSYKSVSDLADYLKSQLGFDVFSASESRGVVVKTVETRNIIVHNRCRINQRFIDRAGGKKEEIGDLLVISPSNILQINSYFDKLAEQIDGAATIKFGIAPICN